MQTILGAGGAIGKVLANALTTYTTDIRLVNRNPEKVNNTDQLFAADLMDPKQLKKAIEGSEIVYVTVGFPYSYRVWQESWPKFMSSLIDACKGEGSKLVFFDNIYMYDEGHLRNMDEDTPINPPSKKGKVRADIVNMLNDEMRKGTLTALIARSADFYGPSIKNSVLTETVFNNLHAGKKANWLASDNCKHSFTYVPDAGKAVALLGNTADAYNQVWHLPTAPDPFTGKEWVSAIAGEMNVPAKYRVASRFMVKVLGLFMPVMKETVEMMYQYDRDYVFNSDKFSRRFGIQATPYREGIREIVETDYRK